MASGCTGSSSLVGGCLNPISDKCVKYTGLPVPYFNICTGDTLFEIEEIVLKALVDFASGAGISITGIDYGACDLFTTYVTCCNSSGTVPKSLKELMQVIFSILCQFDTRIKTLETFMTELETGPYTTSCLTLGANPKFKDIIKAVITKVCELNTRVTALETAFTTLSGSLGTTIGNFLRDHVNSCQGATSLIKTGTGASFNLNIVGFAPIGSIVAYKGDMSLFDSDGLGRDNYPTCGWALCDGRSGRPNLQGVTLMGASVSGGVTNPAADGQTYSVGTTGGKAKVLLTSLESGSGNHSHTINDPGHSHIFSVNLDSASGSNNANYMKFDTTSFNNTLDGAADIGNIRAKVRTNYTGITVNNGGGSNASVAHENRPPYHTIYWIIRLS